VRVVGRFIWDLIISSYRFCLAIRDLLILNLPYRNKRNSARIGFLIHDRDERMYIAGFQFFNIFLKISGTDLDGGFGLLDLKR